MSHLTYTDITNASNYIWTRLSAQTRLNVFALKTWKTIAIVRNPYQRVLSAYEQRISSARISTQWRRMPSGGFVGYMRWLRKLTRNNNHVWYQDKTIIHFRPGVLYTHDSNLKLVVDWVFRLEDPNTTIRVVSILLGRYPSHVANARSIIKNARTHNCNHTHESISFQHLYFGHYGVARVGIECIGSCV